ncbi:hypothetical protein ABZ388_00370 [Micromonospora parva]|uniref:hypothetical protein n=1 Tax=Micromonospora parva TaxID=1464048 RepID=UPI0004C1FEFF|nr:hypothetical protein [Micromonospora parva]
MPANDSSSSRSWWESAPIRALEAVGILAAIATGVGSLALSVATFRDQQQREQDQQQRERSEIASSVVLVPGDDKVLLQNYGRLPVFNVGIKVGEEKGVMLGVLPPCYAFDVTPYGEFREIKDRDGDGVGESDIATIIEFSDPSGSRWHRTGVFGKSQNFNQSLSKPTPADSYLPVSLPSPNAVPRRADPC